VALGKDLNEAWERAFDCDPISAFGGIVAFNGKIEKELAEKLKEIFLEVIVSPEIEEEALKVLSSKKNLRVLSLKIQKERKGFDFKRVSGGFLIQEWEEHEEKMEDFKVVTKNSPTELQWKDLIFAWKVVKNIKSNGILFAKNLQTLGIGSGQTSRVDSVKVAAMKAKLPLEESVCASDGFFPFPDGVEEIYKAGGRTIIAPGGSIKDKEVIEKANALGISMVFSPCRHFRH
ncbi:MAG: bifunctional phosphoribosylaminoimidazolecarboxamide formyltransferase/IMP cyclohydrolase, partial [Thermoanaerobaculia bacterium]